MFSSFQIALCQLCAEAQLQDREPWKEELADCRTQEHLRFASYLSETGVLLVCPVPRKRGMGWAGFEIVLALHLAEHLVWVTQSSFRGCRMKPSV